MLLFMPLLPIMLAKLAHLRSALHKRPAKQTPAYDQMVVWLSLILLMFSLVMVYSASIATAEGNKLLGYQPAYYLMRQSIFVVVGLLVAGFTVQIPIEQWQKSAPALFVGGVVLLILVLVPGIGREVNGSRRWLSLFVINLQPSELMKFFVSLYAADYTVRKLHFIKSDFMESTKKGFLPMMIVMVLVGGLLLREPDFGAFVVITSIAIGILFLGGMNWRLFAVLIVGLLIGFVLMVALSPYRLQRVTGFMDPWADPFGKGYQLSHALIAFGRGEFLGVGLGASVEKLFYLPEAHTDFLLAVVAEELGFVGVCVCISLFVWLVFRAFAIGRQAASLNFQFAALVAQGIGIWLGVQSLINMGVNVGLLPTKGLTLPFMSFGGSGVLANCVGVAVLLRIDWENRAFLRGQRK